MPNCLIHIPHKTGLLTELTANSDEFQRRLEQTQRDSHMRENWSAVERFINEVAPECFGGGLRFHTVVMAASDSQLRGQSVDFQGDGTPAGDLIAYNAAISVLQGNSNQGGTLILLEGNYFFDTPPTDLEHISLVGQGNGTIIYSSASTPLIVTTADAVIREIQFIAQDAAAGLPIVQVNGGECLIHSCYFHDGGVECAGVVPKLDIRDCSFYGTYTTSVITLAEYGRVVDCLFSGVDFGAGTIIDADPGSTIRGNRFESCTSDVIVDVNSGGSVVSNYVDAACESATSFFDGGGGSMFVGNEFFGTITGTDPSNAAIRVLSESVVISSNSFIVSGQSVGCFGSGGVSITGNAFSPGLTTVITADGDGATITGNVFNNISGVTAIDLSGNKSIVANNTYFDDGSGTFLNITGSGNVTSPNVNYF